MNGVITINVGYGVGGECGFYKCEFRILTALALEDEHTIIVVAIALLSTLERNHIETVVNDLERPLLVFTARGFPLNELIVEFAVCFSRVV